MDFQDVDIYMSDLIVSYWLNKGAMDFDLFAYWYFFDVNHGAHVIGESIDFVLSNRHNLLSFLEIMQYLYEKDGLDLGRGDWDMLARSLVPDFQFDHVIDHANARESQELRQDSFSFKEFAHVLGSRFHIRYEDLKLKGELQRYQAKLVASSTSSASTSKKKWHKKKGG